MHLFYGVSLAIVLRVSKPSSRLTPNDHPIQCMLTVSSITEEETLLVGFFGSDYVRYRDKTMVGIPLIP